jgi:hypothetical protein
MKRDCVAPKGERLFFLLFLFSLWLLAYCLENHAIKQSNRHGLEHIH